MASTTQDSESFHFVVATRDGVDDRVLVLVIFIFIGLVVRRCPCAVFGRVHRLGSVPVLLLELHIALRPGEGSELVVLFRRDLVLAWVIRHEFVANQGLDDLVPVGTGNLIGVETGSNSQLTKCLEGLG